MLPSPPTLFVFIDTVLHYDADYERIAKHTGQAVQWIVPRGSVA